MSEILFSPEQKRKIDELLPELKAKDKKRLQALIAISNCIPMGSMYVKVPAMRTLISECNILEALLGLEEQGTEITVEETFFFSQIVSKIIVSSDEICSFKDNDIVRRYYKYLIKMSGRTDIPETISNNIFSRGVYYMTCVDKEHGAETLCDVIKEESKAGRLFNAGHAALDWLFCIEQSRVLTVDEVLMLVEIITSLCKNSLLLQESEMTSGFAKGLLWLTSNFKFFFFNGVQSNPAWLTAIESSRLITTETIAGFAKLIKIGLSRSLEINDTKYYEKFVDMGRNSVTMFYNFIKVDGPEVAINYLYKAYLHITFDLESPDILNEDEPIVVPLTDIEEFAKRNGQKGLFGWIEAANSDFKLVNDYIDSLGANLDLTEEHQAKTKRLIYAGIFLTKYLTMYNALGTHILERIASSKQMEYYRPFFDD